MSSAPHYGWLSDFKEFFRYWGFVVVVGAGLAFLCVVTPRTTNSFRPSYAESTPIKVATSTSAKVHKKPFTRRKLLPKDT